jgi:hypothetical protein
MIKYKLLSVIFLVNIICVMFSKVEAKIAECKKLVEMYIVARQMLLMLNVSSCWVFTNFIHSEPHY